MWLSSLTLFAGRNLNSDLVEEKVNPGENTSPVLFSRWLKTTCQTSVSERINNSSWGHFLLAKIVVDKTRLFRCRINEDGESFCLPLCDEKIDAAPQPPIKLNLEKYSSSPKPSGCFSSFVDDEY